MGTTANTLNELDLGLNTFASDTLGVLWRAASGTVDPWSQAVLEDQATQSYIAAGADPDSAAAQAAADVAATLGSAPSPSNSALLSGYVGSLFSDAGTGCSLLTNPAGCYPSWVPYVAIGILVLGVLFVLGPYVGLLEHR